MCVCVCVCVCVLLSQFSSQTTDRQLYTSDRRAAGKTLREVARTVVTYGQFEPNNFALRQYALGGSKRPATVRTLDLKLGRIYCSEKKKRLQFAPLSIQRKKTDSRLFHLTTALKQFSGQRL